nr:MAG TPA: hypothetical protein [Caudoviricetes sp.]DAX23890.1 MAG TPA: hypothetical protein [Caudoviricetes sp.]
MTLFTFFIAILIFILIFAPIKNKCILYLCFDTAKI